MHQLCSFIGLASPGTNRFQSADLLRELSRLAVGKPCDDDAATVSFPERRLVV